MLDRQHTRLFNSDYFGFLVGPVVPMAHIQPLRQRTSDGGKALATDQECRLNLTFGNALGQFINHHLRRISARGCKHHIGWCQPQNVRNCVRRIEINAEGKIACFGGSVMNRMRGNRVHGLRDMLLPVSLNANCAASASKLTGDFALAGLRSF
ncbi:MAG: hypothetical protein CM15mP21_2620 [Hyphomicrobiales bacterium]|nr:MAG: hypothetical protein CM15mP21_2620 [Hyphomicrobiales bacterium]